MPKAKPTRHDVFADFGAPPTPSAHSESARYEVRPPHEVETDFHLPAGSDSPLLQPELVEILRPSQMMPDPFQPRVSPLPQAVRVDFFSGRLDAYQAARAWLALAERDPAGIGARLDRLDAMGSSLAENGQINPITGRWEGSRFRIETGEQRFWSAVIHAVRAGQAEEPLLRVVVIDSVSRERQIIENRHLFPPSAVTQAREIAALILERMGMFPVGTPVDGYEYFRQVIEMGRLPNGVWEQIQPLMQLSRRRMAQLISILRLPSPLLDLADLHGLSDGVLRAVLARPADQWEGLIRRAIVEQLTSQDVQELPADLPAPLAGAAEDGDEADEPAARQPKAHLAPVVLAVRGIRRFQKSVARAWRTDQRVLDQVADELYGDGHAEQALAMLEELAALVRVRLEGDRKQ